MYKLIALDMDGTLLNPQGQITPRTHAAITAARAKGVKERVVLFRHALRAGLTPIVTAAGIDLAALFGGAIITEAVFTLPGLGGVLFDALARRDYPVIQAIAVYLAALTMVINLIVDVLFKLVDPRVVLK